MKARSSLMARLGMLVLSTASFGVHAQETLAPGSVTYTCCNLHYDRDWISDANWATLPFFPAGSRIALVDYRRNYASVYVEGKRMYIGHDYGGEQETREQFVERLIVKEDPKLRMATYAPDVQAAIRAAKVMPGMTQEQVIMSLGYPRADTTPDRQSNEWTYWTLDAQQYTIVWNAAKRVQSIEAALPVKRQVAFDPAMR
ncbi:hypothetical protein [uncultured Oxalicibacterium sp.]|uniref:hypothetical protein n=1 Tax=uncultured Oxalicibacterium sp. TaxID=1168540 RepID=UPI0025F75909|nr:hypothetical protein [uncultured Oxalicibacterium sp.]